MTRHLGSRLFDFWLHLRRRRACEDDRNPHLAERWDRTMANFEQRYREVEGR